MPRRPPPALVAGALVVASLALAAVTLLAPSSPSYDPFAWIVWGRELAGGEPFGLAGGPSWKPLPVLFTAPFSLAGAAAPALWLLVARAGMLLALAGAFALARRLGGVLAGVVATLALLLLADVVSLAWRGASEPLLLAALLWAGERHLAGARRTAFALGLAAGLIRPETWPFLLLYALAIGREAGAHERLLLLGGLALLPLLWIGVPALGGDALAASTTATNPGGHAPSAWTALRRGLGLAPAPVWALALAAVALRPRDRHVRTLALATVAWLALVVAMAAAGYAGVARYMLPAAAVGCVLAGIGAAALAAWAAWAAGDGSRRAALASMVVLVLAAAGLAAERGGTLDDQVRDGTAVAAVHDELRTAVARAGGATALHGCALHGWVSVNHTTQTTLAWELRVGLDRVARTMSRPGLLFLARRSAATGGPPTIALTRQVDVTQVARAGPWRVVTVGVAGTRFPPACGSRKASGSARRIPNI